MLRFCRLISSCSRSGLSEFPNLLSPESLVYPQLAAWINTHALNSRSIVRNEYISNCGARLTQLEIPTTSRSEKSVQNILKWEKVEASKSLIDLTLPSYLQRPIIDEFPNFVNHRSILKLPSCVANLTDFLEMPSSSMELPALENMHEKQAARLIVIRRRKMKKHKLKKLRKKMKFEWAKVRQRREMRKEKSFQAVLLAQIKEAEKFDAAQYVAEKLRKAHEVPIPRTWKGKRLPEFIIKEKLGIK